MKIEKSFVIEDSLDAGFIAESFGVTGGYVNHIFDLEIPDDFDVLYITGESGCGKSVMLNEICHKLGIEQKEVEIPSKPLFLWCGDSLENQVKAVEMLSLVGVSDAVLWMNTYENLSDSQKARARIFWKLLEENPYIVVDEFLSTLDRKTAKAVAYSMQKAIRKCGKKAILVTAHSDLDEYLMPDYTIYGTAFPSRWSIQKNRPCNNNPILKNVVISYGQKQDYKISTLGELHYKGKYTGGTKDFLFARLDGLIIGVLVSIYNMHTGGRRIARLVVHPSYRGCGIGQALVRKYVADFPDTDVVAAMAAYNPVFERAGMVRDKDSTIKPPAGLEKDLKAYHFDSDRWYDKKYLVELSLDEEFRKMLSKYAKHAETLVCPGGKRLKMEDISSKITKEPQTAARVLFGFRPRILAKYKSKKINKRRASEYVED